MWFKRCRIALPTGLLLLPTCAVLTGCSKSSKPLASVFATPDEAANALITGARSGDRTATALEILGPDSKDLISSGDPVQDKESIDAFMARYEAMHRWRRMPDGSQMLLVGADNYAFPIPLKKNADGKWSFDTAAGREEILNRRIGRNELAVIEICRAAAQAQTEYHSQLHDGAATKQYAWQSAEGQPRSPLGPLAAFATSEGYTVKPDAHVPFHGYFFHMLAGQSNQARGGAKNYVVAGKMTGGFAFVAYPAEYRNSGVMTFIINQDGALLQKNLGNTTVQTASAMTEFDPDNSWSLVEE
jgi:hypothetical protein